MGGTDLTPVEQRFVDLYLGDARGDPEQVAVFLEMPIDVVRDIMKLDRVRSALGARLADSQLGHAPVTPMELHFFWGQTMRDPLQSMKYRLKASEYIARTHGMLRDVHEGRVDINVQAALQVIRQELGAASTSDLQTARKRIIDIEAQ